MRRRTSLALSLFLTTGMVTTLAPALRADGQFAIKDGDRIVFYGDSITDQRLYTTFVETYIVTRFPTLDVTFIHSGWGGDRVTGGGGGPIDHRLERDVFAYKPTVVTVMLGMNDASYRPFDQKIFDTYARGYTHLVESLKSNLPGVRITLIEPSPFDDVTRRPTFEGGYNQVLKRYGEFVKTLASKEGATVADLNTPVVEALTQAMRIDAKTAQKLIQDRVHPGPGGQLLMAEALLKAWSAPAIVSEVELDGAAGKVVKTANTKVDDFRSSDGTLSWRQHDQGLPMPINLKDPVIALAVKASDVEQALNQQILKATGLTQHGYALSIDGKQVGIFTKEQLAAGVNLAEIETPMFRQASDVHKLTLRHNELHFLRWRTVQVPNERKGYAGLAKAIAGLDALESDERAEQRAAAQPVAHRFELVPRK